MLTRIALGVIVGVLAAGVTTPASSASPAHARDFFKVLRSARDADDRMPSIVRSDVRTIEIDFEIDVDWGGIREVYRHRGKRAWLVPGKGWLCLVIKDRGGSVQCATLPRARRGRLGTTYGAGSHGAGWQEEYHVIPDGYRRVAISAENGWTKRPQVRHSMLHAFFPTPAELTFSLHGRVICIPFSDDGFPVNCSPVSAST